MNLLTTIFEKILGGRDENGEIEVVAGKGTITIKAFGNSAMQLEATWGDTQTHQYHSCYSPNDYFYIVNDYTKDGTFKIVYHIESARRVITWRWY